MLKKLFILLILIVLFIFYGGKSNAQAVSALSKKQQISRLHEQAPDLNPRVLTLAINAYYKAEQKGLVKKPVLAVIDYSLDSAHKRLWVFDLARQRMPFHTYVAHGKNSGLNKSHTFSNRNDSKKSSLGLFVTRKTYYGRDGYSLRLTGLEKGFNDQAYRRHVVMHGAWYVNASFIKSHHRAGRSWGCPAVPKLLARPIINTLKDGAAIFAYYPDKNWLRHSIYTA